MRVYINRMTMTNAQIMSVKYTNEELYSERLNSVNSCTETDKCKFSLFCTPLAQHRQAAVMQAALFTLCTLFVLRGLKSIFASGQIKAESYSLNSGMTCFKTSDFAQCNSNGNSGRGNYCIGSIIG